MAIQLQIRRGTTAENDVFTGAVGELTMDTDTNGVRIHDGTTTGGVKIPTASTSDYVVEWQMPTDLNGYTWYRKYKSGWVEQGGFVVINSASVAGATYNNTTVTFPVPMSCVSGWQCQAKHDRFNTGFGTDLKGAAASSANIYQVNDSTTAFANPYVVWEVKGIAA